MFKVPVEKHGVNGHLRQKGKIAELSCIAEGQPVLTRRGLVPIQEVRLDDELWDSEAWVHHEGVVFKGEKEVIEYFCLRTFQYGSLRRIGRVLWLGYQHIQHSAWPGIS